LINCLKEDLTTEAEEFFSQNVEIIYDEYKSRTFSTFASIIGVFFMEGPETELKSLTISEIGFLVKSFDELMNSCLINSNDNYLELYLDKELKKLSVLKHNNNDIRSKLLKSKPKIKEKKSK